MNESTATLGAVSLEYARKANEYEGIALTAANAEATYKHKRAVFITKHRFEDPKASVAWLEVQAEADDELAALLHERLRSAAVLDAASKKLQQLRERVATGRTYAASEREADRMHAQGLQGAA